MISECYCHTVNRLFMLVIALQKVEDYGDDQKINNLLLFV